MFLDKIVKRIEDFREEKDLLQKEIARNLGMSTQSYTDLKKNKRKLHINEIIALKEKYNLNPNYILFGDQPKWYANGEHKTQLEDESNQLKEYDLDPITVLKEAKIKAVLDKLFDNNRNQPLMFKFLKRQYKEYNNILYIITDIIKKVKYSNNAKEEFFTEIRKYPYRFIDRNDVPQKLNTLFSQLSNQDCLHLINDKDIAIKLIEKNINKIDLLIEKFFSKIREKHEKKVA